MTNKTLKIFDEETVTRIIDLIRDQKQASYSALLNAEKNKGSNASIAFTEGEIAAFKNIEHVLRTEILGQSFYCGHYYDHFGKRMDNEN